MEWKKLENGMEKARAINKMETNLSKEKQSLLMQPTQKKQTIRKGLHSR